MSRNRLVLTAALLLIGCGDRHHARLAHGDTAGDRLEAAAIADGVVADPSRVDPTGLYASGDDRVCVVPRASGGYAVGLLVRYDETQGCAARGTAARTGDRLDVDLTGDLTGDCRFGARFEGDRIVFPAELPPACGRRCTGRASLGALAVDRLSDGTAEASAQRDATGRPLCS